MSSNVNIESNFISKDVCDYLINYFTSFQPEKTDEGVYFNWGKTKGQSFDEIEDKASRVIIKEIIKNIESRFILKYSPANIQFKRCLIQTMTEGGSISLHSDNISALDEENVVQDVYSAIVYLTDDYLGGEINFPNSSIKAIPESGSLIYFKGEEDNPHLVKPVISGKRINFILFFEDIISL